MPTPHDEFFRTVFSEPEAARDLVRSAVAAERLARLDLETLTIANASFTDEESRPGAADLLLRVSARAARAGASRELSEAFIYILFEHKSFADPKTLLQLLRYMTRIWDRYRRENSSGLLPPVLPIIVFHGSAPWSGPRAFKDTVQSHGNYVPHIPDFIPILFDLVTTSDDALPEDFPARFAMRLLKYARRDWRQTAAVLADGEAHLRAGSNAASIVRAGLRYTHAVSTSEAYGSIMKTLKEVRAPMVEKEFVSAAEAFQREGEQRGRIQGKQQVLARHVERKFGLLSGERLRIEAERDPETLDAALDAVLFAESKEEVLSHLERPASPDS